LGVGELNARTFRRGEDRGDRIFGFWCRRLIEQIARPGISDESVADIGVEDVESLLVGSQEPRLGKIESYGAGRQTAGIQKHKTVVDGVEYGDAAVRRDGQRLRTPRKSLFDFEQAHLIFAGSPRQMSEDRPGLGVRPTEGIRWEHSGTRGSDGQQSQREPEGRSRCRPP